MSIVDQGTLEVVDAALFGIGGLCCAAFVFALIRSGRWRNPLEGLEGTGRGPEVLHLVAVILIYWSLAVALLMAAGVDREAVRQPGSDDWHRARAADGLTQLVTSILIVIVLLGHRSFPADKRFRLGIGGVLCVGLIGALIVVPISTLQLHMDTVVWRWLEPDVVPPEHVVLQVLQDSATSPGHKGQLFVLAVIVAPLAEEMFFRGLLLETIWRHVGLAWPAVAVSAVAFGLVHGSQPQAVLPMISLGVMLGYIRLRYRSLPACVLVHALFNARTMIYYLLDSQMMAQRP